MVAWFLVWRLWLFVPLLIATLFVPFRSQSEFTSIRQHIRDQQVVSSDIVYPWANFDGVHYLAIASRGYVDEGRFMPLFPLVIFSVAKIFSPFESLEPFGTEVFWAGVVVHFIATLGALAVVYRLLRLDYSISMSQSALFWLLVFPTAFIYGCIYSEGLFLLLSSSALLFARKQKWFFAALMCMLLAVTRLAGLLVLLPVLYEFYMQEVQGKNYSKKIVLPLMWFALSPVLLIGYAYFNFVTWGDPLYFVHAHGALGNSREVTSFVFPLVTVYRYIKIVTTVSPALLEYWVAVIEFLSVFFAVFAGVGMILQKQRFTYVVYAIALLILPLFSGTFSGFPRYLLPVFPLFLSQSLWLHDKPKVSFFISVVSLVLQGIFVALFVRGYYLT